MIKKILSYILSGKVSLKYDPKDEKLKLHFKLFKFKLTVWGGLE